jgi:hypothetical protein
MGKLFACLLLLAICIAALSLSPVNGYIAVHRVTRANQASLRLPFTLQITAKEDALAVQLVVPPKHADRLASAGLQSIDGKVEHGLPEIRSQEQADGSIQLQVTVTFAVARKHTLNTRLTGWGDGGELFVIELATYVP